MTPLITTSLTILTLVATLSYLLGSVPFGMLVARFMGLGNLRDIGSGNIGATNVLRTGNKTAAFLTLLFDAGKGAVVVLVAQRLWGNDAAQIAGLCAFLGHLFPIWLGFKGGKGMATFLGVILSLSFTVGFAACMTWLATAIVFRMSSLAALVAAASTGIWMWVFGVPTNIALAVLLTILVFIRHKDNISRLIAGHEPKIGASKDK